MPLRTSLTRQSPRVLIPMHTQEWIFRFMDRKEVSAPDYFLIAPQRVIDSGLGSRYERPSAFCCAVISAPCNTASKPTVSPSAEAAGKRLAVRAESDEPREAHLECAAIEAANRTIDSPDIWPNHEQAT
jgi:hypothetical protein